MNNKPGSGRAGDGLNRRRFLQVAAGAAGSISFRVPLAIAAGGADTEINAYLLLHPDSTATVTVPQVELGQGIRTALPVLVAEELELPLNRVRIRDAHGDATRYGNQATSGSNSVRTRYIELRRTGAAAREMLRAAAATRWNVVADSCIASQGEILHAPTGRSLAYGELLTELADMPVPENPTLKPADQFTLIGQSRPHADIRELATGNIRYGIDTRLPGLRYAAVARCPMFGGDIESYDATSALAVPGVEKVIPVPAVQGNAHVSAGLAVIANSTFAALRGRDALQVDWSPPDGERESDAVLSNRADALLSDVPEDMLYSRGDPQGELANTPGERVVSADYDLPFLAHATMEPMNCTAQVTSIGAEIWAPTQTPNFAAALIAAELGIDRQNVRMNITRVGGGFGRRLNVDFAVEAALIARQVDHPVKVTWSREDDTRHDFYRPKAVHRLIAAQDERGDPVAWRHHITSAAIFAKYQLGPYSERPGAYEVIGALDLPYGIAHRDCGFSLLPARVPRGWWRAVSTTHTTFAVECFIDELANAAGRDPLDYRLQLIDALPDDVPLRYPEYPFDPERMRNVLETVAASGRWNSKPPQGHGLGIACSWDHLSYAAHVVEVSEPEPGGLRVHRVASAIDCGTPINPEGIRAQVEGSVIQGLSAAMRERIGVDEGGVVQTNFNDYPVLRMAEVPPEIVVDIVKNEYPPTGAGEPALPAVAPALANALFAATGRRYRRLPLNRENLLSGTPD